MSHRDHHRNSAQQTAASTPTLSDDVLVEYLFGHTSAAQRSLVESWLLGDSKNGDYLCSVATTLVELGQAFENQQASSLGVPALVTTRDCNLSTANAVLRRKADGASRALVWFAIAASLVGLIVSLRGFQSEDLAPQLAMAWVETLASGNELNEPQGLSHWSIDAVSFEDNDREEERVPLADEFGDVNLEEDAYSLEPPDWLLVAVREMDTDSQADDAREALP